MAFTDCPVSVAASQRSTSGKFVQTLPVLELAEILLICVISNLLNGVDCPIHTYINLPVQPGMSLEKALHALPRDPSAFHGMQMPDEIRTACTKIACTICLLENDPSIIEPDVLSKDQMKYELNPDPAIVERAHRRGKVGWIIGRNIEVIPHIRRSHPALMWTGHGRQIPRIVMRKGSVVHREIVEKVPTGFQGESWGIKL